MAEDQSDSGRFFGLRFTRSIDLGTIISLVIILGGGAWWALAGYYQLHDENVKRDSRMDLLEQRLTLDEKSMFDIRESNRAFQVEMRAALERIYGQISDVRALLGGSSNGQQRR